MEITYYKHYTHREIAAINIQVDAQNAAARGRAANINIEQIFVEILYGIAATVFCITPFSIHRVVRCIHRQCRRIRYWLIVIAIIIV
jgi:hypothetical protein